MHKGARTQPTLGSQESEVQSLRSSQASAAPPPQFPLPSQASARVQALSSVQGVPTAATVASHRPVAGLQMFGLQVGPGPHRTGTPPMQ